MIVFRRQFQSCKPTHFTCSVPDTGTSLGALTTKHRVLPNDKSSKIFSDECGVHTTDLMRPKLLPDHERLVHQLIAAEKKHLTNQIAALQTSRPSEHFTTHQTSKNTLTILSSPRFGWKLNHTVGFGLANLPNAPTSTTGKDDGLPLEGLLGELREIEALYRASPGFPPRIDLCEFADGGAAEVLMEQGFEVDTRIETFALDLRDGSATGEDHEDHARPIAATVNGVEIQKYNPREDVEEFVLASIEGFRSNGRSAELLGVLAESAAHRSDTVRYRALVDGHLAGTAGMAIFDVGLKVATLYIDSTLDGFRGKGVHRALLQARIMEAKRAGCDVVTASARERSGSSRNIMKAGLKRAYTCVTFIKKSF